MKEQSRVLNTNNIGQTKINSSNKLNDLSAKEWLINTKSVWLSSDYHLPKNDRNEIRYLRNLILFFTKKDHIILNPYNNIDIKNIGEREKRIILAEAESNVDFILFKTPQKFINSTQYIEFLTSNKLSSEINHYYKILKAKKYLCAITRDFYFEDNSELVLYHCDLANLLKISGFQLKGLTVWVPEQFQNRNPNVITDPNHTIMNDYFLIFRKENEPNKPLKYNKLDFKLNFNKKATFQKDTLYHKSYMKSISPPREKYKAQHPATFPEPDIKNLIKFYTKINRAPKILDPFSGVGSSLIACLELQIQGFGIELTKKWIELTKKRFFERDAPIIVNGEKFYHPLKAKNTLQGNNLKKYPFIQILEQGDALEILQKFPDNFFDFVITSPPYWGILTKKIDHKMKKERVKRGFETKYTIQGKDETYPKDLANIDSYTKFLNQLKKIYERCYKKLKDNKYMAIIVSDFRHGPEFYLYHSDTADLIKQSGFQLTSVIILHQNNKNLYPYGYPYSFVSNIHHQFIMIAKKENN